MRRSRSDWRRLCLIHAQFVVFAGIKAVLWGQTTHRVFLDCNLMVFASGFIMHWMGTRPLQQDRHLCQGAGDETPT